MIYKEKRMKTPQGWTEITNAKSKPALRKEFNFKDFKEAFSFMTTVAQKAEEMGHHPEWFNVYNQVHVELTTHDEGGVTEKDFSLAEFMNKVSAT